MDLPQLDYVGIPDAAQSLRQEVRNFLAIEIADRTPRERAYSWSGYDPDFSKKLGAKKWLGLTLPKKYGGQEMGAYARYVIIEELLASGAPVAAHWIADRQSAPLILNFGTEDQRKKYIPPICSGESYFCIGMSEPNSGSDLASIRTKAEKNQDGWVLNGQKVWTTNAHNCHYMIALVRTAPPSDNRHAGMSQVIIDLSLPGVTIRPIKELSGDAHFNEVIFEDVQLGPDTIIGTEGEGWQQVMAELAFERSGPERFLSSIAVVNTLVKAVGPKADALQRREIGRMIAKTHALRSMSLGITAQLDEGENPTWHASCVKDMGNAFEQEIPELAQLVLDTEPRLSSDDPHAEVLAYLIQTAPSFSLRGGTREILRGIIARGLGLR
ncbi:MAG: acyl-CoA dehydrogenase [Acidimicrobiales bacterium]|nr:acyl-CoA dehydrogenase [Hyphomonadaceae bacterium]RZV43190.1 MAG: acyl-CoA dehydrogenase [Acidimicrobiales bacterium]